MALTNGTNAVAVNGDAAHLNGTVKKIKNKAALKRAKQKKAKLAAASRESSVVRYIYAGALSWSSSMCAEGCYFLDRPTQTRKRVQVSLKSTTARTRTRM